MTIRTSSLLATNKKSTEKSAAHYDTQFVQIGRSPPKSRAPLTEAKKFKMQKRELFARCTHVYSHVGRVAYVNFVYLLCKLHCV